MTADKYQANQYRLLEAEWLLLLFERSKGRPAITAAELAHWAATAEVPRLHDASESDRATVYERRASRGAPFN